MSAVGHKYTFTLSDFCAAVDLFKELQKRDPYGLDHMDTYSNILFVKVRRWNSYDTLISGRNNTNLTIVTTVCYYYSKIYEVGFVFTQTLCPDA